MKFDIFFHDGVIENQTNVIYPDKLEITDVIDMVQAVGFDHVCAEYKDNRRSNDNFIKSNVVVMDCDNDQTDKPEDWLNTNSIMSLFSDYSFVLVPSRNNMKEKGEKSARPRFHMYFPINECTSKSNYARLKSRLYIHYPFFDDNALDAGRFIFGSPVTEEDIVWNEGTKTIDQMPKFPTKDENIVNNTEAQDTKAAVSNDPEKTKTGQQIIQEGERNSTLFRYAMRVMKRFGLSDRTRALFDQEAEKCIPPLSAKELESIWKSASHYCPAEGEIQAEASMEPSDYTDIGQGKVFVREFGDEILYTDSTGYLRYNGKIWSYSDQYAVGAIEEFLDMQLADAEDSVKSAEAEAEAKGCSIEQLKKAKIEELTPLELSLLIRYTKAELYHKYVLKYRNMNHMKAVLDAVKPMVQVDFNVFDSDPNLFNTPDEAYYLPEGLTGKRDHRPEDHFTKMTLVSAGDQGKQLWLDALDLFFSGDKALIEYVQMSVGTAAFGKVLREGLIIAIGDGGNGKSTFWNTILHVFGSYGGVISTNLLMSNSKVNLGAEIAELKGKRLVIASELEENQTLSTSMVKKICSTDPILGEIKFKQPFSFIPSHTAILYTNHLPNVKSIDNGIWRRLIVIPFNTKIPKATDIKNYTDFLVKNAGPAIMSWIIEGARKAYQFGFEFTMPSVVATATAEYREQNDWINDFIDACCVLGTGFSTSSGKLYDEYKEYCQKNGEHPRGVKSFVSGLQSKGFNRRKTNKGKIFDGIGLLSQESKLGV